MAPTAAPTVALCGGTVVIALDPPEVLMCDVVLAGERVVALGTAPAGVPRHDCSGALVVPGNVCAHHHLYSALSRGMPYGLAPPRNFTEVLQRVWWRLDRALDENAVRASALRGGLDALLAGTTTIVDHHASPNFIDGSLDVIADALAELGVRSVLCYEVSDRDGPGRAVAGLAENRRFLAHQRRLARGMMGAHASFTLSDATLAACAEAARVAGTGVHIHVAEDAADQRDCGARAAGRVVERLHGAGIVTDRALLAHCVHVDRAEMQILASTGATVVCNPRSNMNNAVGHSPFNLRRVEGTGAKVALGTDGIGGDMVTESQVGFFRAREADMAVPPSWPLVRLAEGSRLAGRLYGQPLLGTLRPGAPADITVYEYGPPAPLDAANLAGHWLFGLSSGQVRDVYVAGELVVAGRASTRVDQAQMAADEAGVARELWQRLEEIPPHEYEPMGGKHR
jgi:putative selenium metabolism protein SsnA